MSEAAEVFVVTDDKAAEWCLKKIKEAENDRAMWKAHYEEQMRKINENCDNTVAFFTAKLEEYFDSVPHKKAKTQESYVIPGGKLVRKQQLPKYDIDDYELVSWLENNKLEAFVKVKKTADWALMKKNEFFEDDGEHILTPEGEIVPGITVTSRPEIFKVEVSE